MVVTEADELPHKPDPDPRWQESYLWHAWDDEGACGVNVHLTSQPHDGYVEAQIIVLYAGEIVSSGGRYAADDPLAIPGLDVDIRIPLERWKIRYSGQGVRGPNKYGFYAHSVGEVPFGFSLDFHQPLRPASFGSLATDTVGGRIADNHYFAGATCSGEVWCAERRGSLTGLLIRDHTWGTRDWSYDLVPAATCLALDGAHTVISAASFLHGDGWSGMCIVHDGDGTRAYGHPWVRLNGLPVIGGYRNATILIPGEREILEFQGQCSTPKWTPSVSSGSNYLWLQEHCSVRWGDKVGQGPLWTVYPATSPLAATLPPDCGQAGPLDVVDSPRECPS